jgi:hypothetical protein
VLIGSFLTIIWAGHVPLMFMILGIQVGAAHCLCNATQFSSAAPLLLRRLLVLRCCC